MPQPVFAKQIRNDDVVWHKRYGQFIAEHVKVGRELVEFTDDVGVSCSVVPGELFVVVQRSYPPGKTEEDMRDEVASAAAAAILVQDDPELFDAKLKKLREVQDAYELGKVLHGKPYCGDGHEFH